MASRTALPGYVARSSHPLMQSPPPPTSRRARLNECDLLISVLECHMMETIRSNEALERTEAYRCARYGRHSVEPSVFHALQAPSITPVEYLRRLARYAFCSRSVFVLAFFYLKRVAQVEGVGLRMNGLSVHRLLLTAVLLATKVVDDVLYDNAHFAKVGGLDIKELNMLELDLLKVLEFRVHVKAEEFEGFERRLLDEALKSRDPEYAILPGRLRNLGYDSVAVGKAMPSSPASTMDICYVPE